MVCNSTQSALYKVINDHNSFFPDADTDRKKRSEKYAEKNYRKSVENNRENSAFYKAEKHCEKCPKKPSARMRTDPISRVLSDKDMLLIAGLIFILARENADKKLILALAIVLLG